MIWGGVALGDLDGDGDLDAWTTDYALNGSSTVWNNDGGGFTDSGLFLPDSLGTGVALGDLNGDTFLDAFVVNGNDPSTAFPNTVWLGDGAGDFSHSGQALGSSSSRAVVFGDMDGDGDLDAYVANTGAFRQDKLYLNNGAGSFTASAQVLDAYFNHAAALGDLDGDGDLDVAIGNVHVPGMINRVWRNDGVGNLTQNGQSLGNSASKAVPLGDLDGDGDLDIFVANSGASPNRVYRNIPFDPDDAPNLRIPGHLGAAAGERVEVPAEFTAHGHDIAAVAFSVDYDESCLDFDPVDADQDGVPDNLAFQLPAGFTPTVFFDLGDGDGEIDVLVADIPPELALPDGVLVTMTFTTTCVPASGQTLLAPVRFSLDPTASFGNLQAESVPGTAVGGSVEIYPGIRGDCNSDGVVDAADVGACGLEIYDGDGDNWLGVGAGYPGSPVGCDSNADRTVDAGDLSCTSRLIFGNCGASRSPHGATGGPRLTLPAAVPVIDGMVRVPVDLDAGGHAISSLVFSLDLDPELLSFDPVDLDQDGVPDAVEFVGVPSSIRSVFFEPGDARGELDFLFTDLAAEPQAIPGGRLLEITFQVADPTAASVQGVSFSQRPRASFGDVTGGSVAGRAHLVPEGLFADGFESGDTSAWSRVGGSTLSVRDAHPPNGDFFEPGGGASP